jgi:hypothetical protein
MMMHLIWKKLLFTPISLLLFFCTVFAQSNNNIEKTLEFDGDDVEKTIPIDVEKGVHSLAAVLNGNIETGSLYVSIIDPDGKRRNGFSLVTGGSEDGHYKINTSSGGSVVHVTKSQGSSSQVISTGEGSSTISISSSGEGTNAGNAISIQSGEGKEKSKDKGKYKVKSKNKNSNSNAQDGSVSTYVSSNDQTGAKGVFVESIEDPIPGTWKLVVDGKMVKGTLDVKIDQN